MIATTRTVLALLAACLPATAIAGPIAAYLEAGGPGVYGSINAEALVSDHAAVRGGIGGYSVCTTTYWCDRALIFPLSTSYLMFDTKSKLEVGGGLTPRKDTSTGFHTEQSFFGLGAFALVGYRYQGARGLQIRVHADVMTLDDTVVPWGGASIGHTL